MSDDLDFSFDFEEKDEVLDTTGWKKIFAIVSNNGNVGKSTFAETVIEIIDFYNKKNPNNTISREYYSFDKDHTNSIYKFASRDARGNLIDNKKQDPSKGIVLCDIEDKGSFINILAGEADIKVADFPARGIDPLLQNAFNGDVQAFVDTIKDNKHLPYIAIPYVSAKCSATVERVNQLFSGVKTNLPIHIVMVLNKGITENIDEVENSYLNDENLEELRSKYIVKEIVSGSTFDNELIIRLKKEKILDALACKDKLSVFSEANMKNYLLEIKPQIMELIRG